MQAHSVGVSAGRPCLLVAHFFYRHAHSSKYWTSVLYRTAPAGLRLDKLNFQPPNPVLQVSSRIEDLSVGMSVEFKAILMADQEVLEWQPGPNCKLELSEGLSSLVVVVPWSYEENLQNHAPDDMEVNDLLRTQDGDEFGSSVASFPDLVEDIEGLELGTHASTSMDVTEEQLNEDSSARIGAVKLNAKDFLDEKQIEAKGIPTGDQGVIDAETSLEPELISSKFSPLFAISESWYGEELKETDDILNSFDLTESEPDFATGETMISVSEVSSDQETKNVEKLVLLNDPDEVIAEVRERSMTVIDAKDENGEKLIVYVEPVEVTAPRNIGIKFPDSETKGINEEESGEKLIIQNGPPAMVAETSLGTTITSTVSDNGNEEAMIHDEPSEVIAEVPETEIPIIARDLLENVEKEPSVIAKDKKWSRKGWAKLWSALVKGHNDDGDT
eukprot:c17881_g1_i2 orf=366-1700(-)